MTFILGFNKKNSIARIITKGSQLDLVTLLIVISKYLIDKLSKEKGFSTEESIEFITSSIKEGYETVQ